MQKDLNRLKKLEDKIYSRHYDNPNPQERSNFEKLEHDVSEAWEGEGDVMELIHQKRLSGGRGSLLKKILIGSIVFFVLSAAVALFMFFGGANQVSSENIDIKVFGPTTIGGGEELSLEIIVTNKNNVDLEGVSLLVQYPSGARVAGNVTEELLRQREPLGSIKAGGEASKVVKSVLFGEKDSIKEIAVTVEYRIKGSSALLYKEKKYDLAIKSSPVIVTVDYPKEVTSGAEIEFVISIASNTGELLRNLLLRVEYPFGFDFISAEPKPIEGDSLWRVGDLPSSERRTIKIRGTLEGQNEEERTFRFAAGVESDKDQNKIAADFVAFLESVTIKKPFLDLAIKISGSLQEPIAKPGEKMLASIVWTNNLPAPILDAKIEVRLSGVVLDRSSVNAGQGYYRSVDNTIIWDKSTSREFDYIDPGERGVVSFTFAPLANISSSLKNQEIGVEITMSGNQILENNRPQTISSTEKREVKIASNLSVAAKIVRSLGPFENSGPMPPKADTETTYTVIWTVTNSLNDISNAGVKATLPPYVSFGNLTFPSSEKVSFNPNTREVFWVLGDVVAGTGFTVSPREAAFQIKFLPSLTQVDTAPNLMGETKISGEDRFTGQTLELSRSPLNTRFNFDPIFRGGDEVVAK